MSEFAKKTGDYEVLSRADVHILALTYELECELNKGDWRLYTEPGSVYLFIVCVCTNVGSERKGGRLHRHDHRYTLPPRY